MAAEKEVYAYYNEGRCMTEKEERKNMDLGRIKLENTILMSLKKLDESQNLKNALLNVEEKLAKEELDKKTTLEQD